MDTIAEFKRAVDALAGIYYRADKGLLTGRNADSTWSYAEELYRRASGLIKADANTEDAPLCAYLDAHPRYAAKWDRVERRVFNLPV